MSAPIVWRGLTAEEVRRQYDMRVAVPDGSTYVAQYEARSRGARERLQGTRNIRYGTGPRQVLDVFPAAAGAPGVLFIHGGAWRYLSKDDFSYLAEPLVAAGISTVLAGYDLHPAATLRQMQDQVCEAVTWTVREVGSRLTIAGHSAGAQLGAMALARDFRGRGLARSPVRAAFLVSGVYDFEPHRHHERYLDLGLDEDTVQSTSPARNPPLDPDLPLVLAAGANETAEYVRHAHWFAGICRERGNPASVLLSPGDHHFSVMDRFADPTHPLTRSLIDLARTA